MAAKRLDQSPFPLLRWDDYFWVGEVMLPSWAGFQARRGGMADNSNRRSDGTARLSVEPLDDKSRTPPTAEQAASFEYLMSQEAAVAAAVGQALVDYYPGEKDAYLDAYSEGEVQNLPDISEPSELQQLIGLSSVHLLSVARDGAAYIGFEFRCVWDEEHGAGVMTHLGRVIAIGQADVSFMAWIAEEDLKGE